MNNSQLRLTTPEENLAFNSSSSIAYRDLISGQVVNLCHGDFEMLRESCQSDFVLPSDFHHGLVDSFLSALAKNGMSVHGFWDKEPQDRQIKFEFFLDSTFRHGKNPFVAPIVATQGGVVLAHFVPFINPTKSDLQ